MYRALLNDIYIYIYVYRDAIKILRWRKAAGICLFKVRQITPVTVPLNTVSY